MYVDIDPLYRAHDSTTWEPLLTDYVPKPDELKVSFFSDINSTSLKIHIDKYARRFIA